MHRRKEGRWERRREDVRREKKGKIIVREKASGKPGQE